MNIVQLESFANRLGFSVTRYKNREDGIICTFTDTANKNRTFNVCSCEQAEAVLTKLAIEHIEG